MYIYVIIKIRIMKLYHSTTNILPSMGFKVKGNCGYGVYLAKSKKYSSSFGDILYSVIVKPKNTLRFDDNDVRGKGFFNMKENDYNSYIQQGYDSLVWYRKGKLTEFILLDTKIITDWTCEN